MPKYRKKPVEIEAIQFTGSNWGEIETFVPVGRYNEDGTFNIVTLEGEHKCSIGDFVIQGVAGEFYPCKPEIFAATHELADPTPVQPDIKPGDKVRGKKKALYHGAGIGIVRCIFWDAEGHWADLMYGNGSMAIYPLDELEVIKDE